MSRETIEGIEAGIELLVRLLVIVACIKYIFG